MKPVAQEFSDTVQGDCFRACLASITELADIPNLIEGDEWYTDYLFHLRDRGWDMYTRSEAPAGYAVGVLWSPTFKDPPQRHAVVVKDGAMVWDPSPLRDEPDREYGPFLYFVEVIPPATGASE